MLEKLARKVNLIHSNMGEWDTQRDYAEFANKVSDFLSNVVPNNWNMYKSEKICNTDICLFLEDYEALIFNGVSHNMCMAVDALLDFAGASCLTINFPVSAFNHDIYYNNDSVETIIFYIRRSLFGEKKPDGVRIYYCIALIVYLFEKLGFNSKAELKNYYRQLILSNATTKKKTKNSTKKGR